MKLRNAINAHNHQIRHSLLSFLSPFPSELTKTQSDDDDNDDIFANHAAVFTMGEHPCSEFDDFAAYYHLLALCVFLCVLCVLCGEISFVLSFNSVLSTLYSVLTSLRNRERERRACIRFALHPDFAPVRLHEPARNRQPQASPPVAVAGL
jgi:hypothetical protein